MLRISHQIIACLIVLLGIVHLIFATFRGNFNLNALWFMGSGFAIIFAGFLNLAFLRNTTKDLLVRSLCVIANLTCAILFTVALLTVLKEPQVILGIALFALATVCSLIQKS